MGGNLAGDCISVNHVAIATGLFLAAVHVAAFLQWKNQAQNIWHRPSCHGNRITNI